MLIRQLNFLGFLQQVTRSVDIPHSPLIRSQRKEYRFRDFSLVRAVALSLSKRLIGKKALPEVFERNDRASSSTT
jgi:hypothetical protein